MVNNTDEFVELEHYVPLAPILGLPPGNYSIVGWDLDTTGRRLIDEICQIAAYTPSSQFSQYIMPYAELNPSSRRRHNIRIVTMGRYRMLKSNASNKALKTKSEISALIDFVDWLEKDVAEDGSDGIILVYHEPSKIIPYMLIEALKKYDLYDRFNRFVKGFANGYVMSEDKCSNTIKSFGLRVLSRVLLDKEESFESAVDRARITYNITEHLCQSEQQDLAAGSGDPGQVIKKNMIEVLRAFTQPNAAEETEIIALKRLIERQNTFRPIFAPMLRISRRDRQHASVLRRLLAEAGIDFEILKAAYEKSGKDGILETIVKLETIKKEQRDDLIEILDSFFDPKRDPTYPNSRPLKTPRGKENKTKTIDGKELKTAFSVDDGAVSPDTTTSSPGKEITSSTVTSSDSTPRTPKKGKVSSTEVKSEEESK